MGWAEGMATASCLYAASSYETHVGIIGLACTACECVRHQGACFRNIKSTVVFQRYESTPQDMGGMYEILGGIFLIFRFCSFCSYYCMCEQFSIVFLFSHRHLARIRERGGYAYVQLWCYTTHRISSLFVRRRRQTNPRSKSEWGEGDVTASRGGKTQFSPIIFYTKQACTYWIE